MNRLKYWNERAETLSRDELAAVQLEGLKRTVTHVWANNEFYRGRLTQAGIEPGDIRALEDIRELPFLTKDDFRDQYPLGMLCMPRSAIREMHMSSGSTGTPVVMAYTEADLAQWAECMARCMVMAGLQAGDAIQIMPTFGLFNGGFGFYHGARRAGLFSVPASSGNTARQIMLMRDFKVKAMGAVVSYAARIIEMLDEKGLELPDLKVGIFGAESFSDEMRKRVESRLGIQAFDIYGMTETGGVGMGIDCKEHSGIHVWDDHYFVEIINPATGEVLPDGEEGEMVVSTLTREGLPLLRYRTRDITRVVSREQCGCGLTTLKIARLKGRNDDMLKVKGVNFYPSQIESLLMEFPELSTEYRIILEESKGKGDVTLKIEKAENVSKDLKDRIHTTLYDFLGFHVNLEIVDKGSIERKEGKAQRVEDRRK